MFYKIFDFGKRDDSNVYNCTKEGETLNVLHFKMVYWSTRKAHTEEKTQQAFMPIECSIDAED